MRCRGSLSTTRASSRAITGDSPRVQVHALHRRVEAADPPASSASQLRHAHVPPAPRDQTRWIMPNPSVWVEERHVMRLQSRDPPHGLDRHDRAPRLWASRRSQTRRAFDTVEPGTTSGASASRAASPPSWVVGGSRSEYVSTVRRCVRTWSPSMRWRSRSPPPGRHPARSAGVELIAIWPARSRCLRRRRWYLTFWGPRLLHHDPGPNRHGRIGETIDEALASISTRWGGTLRRSESLSVVPAPSRRFALQRKRRQRQAWRHGGAQIISTHDAGSSRSDEAPQVPLNATVAPVSAHFRADGNCHLRASGRAIAARQQHSGVP